ncbi:hypothetical protein BOX15_Mlig014341g1, partial [Macrostomum lignano]
PAMNLELLESFHKNYPEENDGVLDCVSFAVTCAFNRFGTLLAVGCNDGRVVIWDFLTRGIAKTITAHAVTVCSVSWSRDSKKLLTASTDNTVALWDVLSGECDKVFRFPSPVLKAAFHPRNSQRLLVCPMRHPPVLVDAETGSHSCLPPDEEGEFSTAAAFNSRGDHVYVGNSRGRVAVYQTRTLRQVAAFRATPATSNTAVKSIEFARKQRNFLLNCSDRIVRVYSCDIVLEARRNQEVEPLQKLKDLVTGNHWRKCCFSGDGEFVCAGSMKAHSIYIWDRIGGAMVKMLQGTKGETLLDVVWHPLRPIICSISNGLVTVWSQSQVQNWSAFAPDFKELDENVEYEERESEFDLSDEDAEPKVAAVPSASNSDEEVDVERCEPVQALLSSDEEADPDMLLFLPVAPEIDDADQTLSDQSLAGTTPDKKRPASSGASPDAKRRKTRTHDIDLPGAPADELHPFLQSGAKKPPGASRQQSTSSSHSTDGAAPPPKKSIASASAGQQLAQSSSQGSPSSAASRKSASRSGGHHQHQRSGGSRK